MRILDWALLALLLTGCGPEDGIDASLAGTYVLDPRAFADEALRRRQDQGEGRLASQGSEQRRVLEATWRQAAHDEAERTIVQMILRADGRFASRYRFGREAGSSSGTWVRQGDRVVLSTTAEKGRRLQKSYETVAAIRGEGLRLEGPRVPIPFTLRRDPR